MKYLIKSVYEIELEIEADSMQDAIAMQDNPEYQYSVYAVMSESGKDIDAQYVDQIVFKLGETI